MCKYSGPILSINPNFPDCHLSLQFQKKLKDDKYVSILEKILDYINKISLIISASADCSAN